jgi:hypothetical protein
MNPTVLQGTKPVASYQSLGEFLNPLFLQLIKITAALAVLVIAYWGLLYMVSLVPGIKLESKGRITAALYGLLLALAALLILNVINPDITKTLNNIFPTS